MYLKRPMTAPFERSEPFHLLRLMGVSVPSLHIESTDSMIQSPTSPNIIMHRECIMNWALCESSGFPEVYLT